MYHSSVLELVKKYYIAAHGRGPVHCLLLTQNFHLDSPLVTKSACMVSRETRKFISMRQKQEHVLDLAVCIFVTWIWFGLRYLHAILVLRIGEQVLSSILMEWFDGHVLEMTSAYNWSCLLIIVRNSGAGSTIQNSNHMFWQMSSSRKWLLANTSM